MCKQYWADDVGGVCETDTLTITTTSTLSLADCDIRKIHVKSVSYLNGACCRCKISNAAGAEGGTGLGHPPGDPLPLYCLARPRGTPVCHLHPWLCEEGTEGPRQEQGDSPSGPLQCGGGAHWDLHCTGHTSRQDDV